MNFNLDEDIQFLKRNVREFIQTEVEAVAMDIEKEDKIPENIIEMSKEMGLFGLSIPEAYGGDRKSTRLNSSHVAISYAVFCLKKKKTTHNEHSTHQQS